MLPSIGTAPVSYDTDTRKMFIVAVGFEKRSLCWIGNEKNKTRFKKTIICKYSPTKKTRYDEMYEYVKKHTEEEPIVFDYNRFEPTLFEQTFISFINSLNDIDEIVIDISVMSKLLIMIILCCLGKCEKKISLLYSEPVSWGPTEEKYKEIMKNKTYGTCIGLSSYGVGNVVRTPMLSSIIMQDCPIILIAFLSFNEQLINVLINEINPTKIEIINHKCTRQKWREKAMYSIHKSLIEENGNGSELNVLSFGIEDYALVFNALADIYRKNCYNYRIVIAPTGCKLHAVSCALFKLCCPDVHIEYPTPESYFFDDYSSDKVAKVHEIVFDNFSLVINSIKQEKNLNG